MSLYLIGVADEGYTGNGLPEGPFRVSGDPDDSTVLRGGLDDLYTAADLWQLCGHEDRAAALRRLLANVTDPAAARNAENIVVSPAQSAQIVNLLDGLDRAVEQITDVTRHEVLPEHVEAILGRAKPGLIETGTRENKPEYSLSRALFAALGVAEFFRLAALDHEVLIG